MARWLSAAHVVIATLGPIHDPALLATRCEARRSYAIAAPCVDPVHGTYISLDASPVSIRPAEVGGRPGLVVGGDGHVVGEHGNRSSEARWAALERLATTDLSAGAATHRWVAHDLTPSDHVPFIGRAAAGAERRWVATGFQKWGIATAYVAADLLLGELQGTPRPWAPLRRRTMTTAREIMTPDASYCPEDATAAEAARKMAEEGVGASADLRYRGAPLGRRHRSRTSP